MTKLFSSIRVPLRDEEGQALVEYALILGLVSVVAIALLTTIGNDVVSLFAKVASGLSAV